MPINYDTLKTSEDNLRRLFLKFYSHVLASQEYLYRHFKQDKAISQDTLDYIVEKEKIANQYEAKILDETIWIISKDQPRAAHLRYLISIIRSIRDLERMGDFVERITRILYRQDSIDAGIKRSLGSLLKNSYDFAHEIFRNINSGSNQTKQYYIKKATPYFREFSAKYRESFKTIGEKIFKSKKATHNKLAIFTALKNIERNADHAFNILENFVYIKEPDFYFRKETRKG